MDPCREGMPYEFILGKGEVNLEERDYPSPHVSIQAGISREVFV